MKYRWDNKSLILVAILLIGLLFALFGQITFTGFTFFENTYNFDDLPDNFELTKGEEFNLDIHFEPDYKFSDNTDLFDINSETGEISFTPEKIGDFKAVIIVLKDVDNFDYKLIEFRVVE